MSICQVLPTAFNSPVFGAALRLMARGGARLRSPFSLAEARYDSASDGVHLAFSNGVAMTIPRAIIPGLAERHRSALKAVTVSPDGESLSWRALDVHIHLPELVEHAFGTRLFAAATGRDGAREPASAKPAASKQDVRKAGRRRKGVRA